MIVAQCGNAVAEEPGSKLYFFIKEVAASKDYVNQYGHESCPSVHEVTGV